MLKGKSVQFILLNAVLKVSCEGTIEHAAEGKDATGLSC